MNLTHVQPAAVPSAGPGQSLGDLIQLRVEPGAAGAVGVLPSVTDQVLAAVYRHAAEVGVLRCLSSAADALGLDEEEARRAVDHLVAGRLLRPDAQQDGFVAIDPEVAAALLVTPMEREIHQREEAIARIRDRSSAFREDYARAGGGGTGRGGIEQAVGCGEVQGYLRLAAEACRGEVMVLVAGGQISGLPDGGALDDFPQVCARLAERGVSVRVVCEHRSRADLRVRTKIRQLSDAGAEVRTVTHVPRAAVVVDRTVAVLLGTAEDGQVSASRVRDAEVACFLLDVFGHLWDVATPLDCLEGGYTEVAGDLRRTIAGLMAKGFTDEVLARKLGMSVRTCRRHIASLMRELDSVSRFQAGVQAAQRSLVTSR